MTPFWINTTTLSTLLSKLETCPNVAAHVSQFQTPETTLHYIVGGPRKGNGVRALGALVFCLYKNALPARVVHVPRHVYTGWLASVSGSTCLWQNSSDFIAQAHIRLLYIKDIGEFVLPDADVSYFATVIERGGIPVIIKHLQLHIITYRTSVCASMHTTIL